MMKLKLLLCYALAFSTICLAADDEDADETVEIVSNPIEAMGQAPRAVAKAVEQSVGSNFVSGSDPYATMQQAARVDVPVGDPYAKNAPKVEFSIGDPYAYVGTTASVALPKAMSVPLKKEKKRDSKEKALAIKKSVNKKVETEVAAKKSKKEPFVPREQSTFTAALFKSVGGDDSILTEAHAAVQAIDNEVKLRESKLKAVAEESLVSVKREITQQAEHLREQADAAAKALKSKTESQVQALLETAEDRIKRLNSAVVQESVKLKQDAAKKALVVIDEMEQRAALRRAEERKKALAVTFGLSESELEKSNKSKSSESHSTASKVGQLPATTVLVGGVNAAQSLPSRVNGIVDDKTSRARQLSYASDDIAISKPSVLSSPAFRVSAEWKNDLSRRFYQDMATMKDIIVEAESPVEAQDFLKKFEAQNRWFDLTLRSTRQVTDDLYSQLVSKQTQMDRLMSSQRIADEYLSRFTKNMLMDPLQIKKMRLGILYELNARLQQRSSHLDRSVRESRLSDDEIKVLVKRTLSDTSQQFREIAAQFPDVEIGSGSMSKPQLSLAAVPLRTQQLEQELSEVRANTEATKQELTETQQQLAQAQKGLVETQETVKKTSEVLEQERQEKEKLAAQNANITAATIDLLGRQTREVVETELAMTGVRQDSAILKADLEKVAEQNSILKGQKNTLIREVENARKDSMSTALLSAQDVSRAKKEAIMIQKNAKSKIKLLKESGARTELGLTADLRQAHEKIAILGAKQTKLVKELELQRETTVKLKASLRQAQEQASRSGAQVALTERALKESSLTLQRQTQLREKAEKRAKVTEDLAQQTIDSINQFLKAERATIKQLAAHDRIDNDNELSDDLADQKSLLDEYRQQLVRDRDLLENLKRETRKVVQHSADLGESLSNDFFEMQEQIENELRQAHQETQKELLVAQKKFDKVSEKTSAQSTVRQLADRSSGNEGGVKAVRGPVKKAIMPGVKQLALKQQVARMPGLAAQLTSERAL